MLIQTKHFLLLQLHIKSAKLVKHKVAFIVKLQHKMQCISASCDISATVTSAKQEVISKPQQGTQLCPAVV